jgi:hypothetical protein
MGGIASRRCDSCRKLVMVSDRGDVETVGAARGVGADRDGTDRAVCVCGMLVTWPKKVGAAVLPKVAGEGALANAHPRHGDICKEIGHDPLNEPMDDRQGGRLVTIHNVCQRCGVVYAIESHV